MAPKPHILLIEDEEAIASLIKLQAELHGYTITTARDGSNGMAALTATRPDIIILDIMLPGQNGFDICRTIKQSPSLKSIPIIILSAKGEELDIVLGLELGADDYVPKPFSPKILFSRIKAVLRRHAEQQSAPGPISFGTFSVDPTSYIVKKSGKPIPVTLSEFGILRRLAANKGKVLTRSQLLEDIQSEEAIVVDRNVDVHIASLRKKLGPNFRWVETVRGVGYRLCDDEAPSVAASAVD